MLSDSTIHKRPLTRRKHLERSTLKIGSNTDSTESDPRRQSLRTFSHKYGKTSARLGDTPEQLIKMDESPVPQVLAPTLVDKAPVKAHEPRPNVVVKKRDTNDIYTLVFPEIFKSSESRKELQAALSEAKWRAAENFLCPRDASTLSIDVYDKLAILKLAQGLFAGFEAPPAVLDKLLTRVGGVLNSYISACLRAEAESMPAPSRGFLNDALSVEIATESPIYYFQNRKEEAIVALLKELASEVYASEGVFNLGLFRQNSVAISEFSDVFRPFGEQIARPLIAAIRGGLRECDYRSKFADVKLDQAGKPVSADPRWDGILLEVSKQAVARLMNIHFENNELQSVIERIFYQADAFGIADEFTPDAKVSFLRALLLRLVLPHVAGQAGDYTLTFPEQKFCQIVSGILTATVNGSAGSRYPTNIQSLINNNGRVFEIKLKGMLTFFEKTTKSPSPTPIHSPQPAQDARTMSVARPKKLESPSRLLEDADPKGS